MFVDDGNTDKGCLRQGDILQRVPFPLLDTRSLTVLGTVTTESSEHAYPEISTLLTTHRHDDNYFTAQISLKLSFCAVISQCCELELRNGKFMPPSFSLARLIPIKESIFEKAEKLAVLRSNPDPRAPAPGFIDYFYIESHEKLLGKEWMIDFSQITSLPKSMFPTILESKILQLDDRTRAKFKIKLSTYFGRFTDEEQVAALNEPWVAESSPSSV